jgi:hypothetical protein
MNDLVRATPPAPGAAAPGDLYVELSSRSIWVGVDPAVDSSHYVLLADIMSIQPGLDSTLSQANAYTDSKITGLAPLASPVFTGDARAPTPPAADNDTSIATTAWVTGAIANRPNQFAHGMVMMYSGLLSDIGVGVLAGWALCDGSNGTPDLRDRFVLGAGNKTPGAVNPQPTASTSAAGAHTPVVNATALTTAQMPNHTHVVAASGSGTTNTENQGHQHASETGGRSVIVYTGGAGGQGTSGGGFTIGSNLTGYETANHNHNFNINVNGTTDAVGGSAAHTHTAAAVPDHSHTLTSAALRDATPYYALAFIMRL